MLPTMAPRRDFFCGEGWDSFRARARQERRVAAGRRCAGDKQAGATAEKNKRAEGRWQYFTGKERPPEMTQRRQAVKKGPRTAEAEQKLNEAEVQATDRRL